MTPQEAGATIRARYSGALAYLGGDEAGLPAVDVAAATAAITRRPPVHDYEPGDVAHRLEWRDLQGRTPEQISAELADLLTDGEPSP